MIYLSWLGRAGLVELGELLLQRTAYARDALAAIDGVELLHEQPVVREFAVDARRRRRRRDRALRRAGRQPRLPARARLPRVRRTACWSRSPSSARKADIDRLARTLQAAVREAVQLSVTARR